MHCISLAILSWVSWFPSLAVGTNWPFCVDVPLNNQSINLSFSAQDFSHNITHLANTIDYVSNWTCCNFLSLNSSKTEFFFVFLPPQLCKLNNPTIHLPNIVILSLAYSSIATSLFHSNYNNYLLLNLLILESVHWLKMNEGNKYKVLSLSLTYKSLKTGQPSYLHSLFSFLSHRSAHSSSLITLSHPFSRLSS